MNLKKVFNIKITLLTLLFLAVAISISSCNSLVAISTSSMPQAAQPLLHFQKTRCYGPCPAYSATIYSDGSITYIGVANVPVTDTIELRLQKKQLAGIKENIHNLHYDTLQTAYLSRFTDMPTTYTTFFENGNKVKKVKYQQGGPEALQEFIKNIDEYISKLVQDKIKS